MAARKQNLSPEEQVALKEAELLWNLANQPVWQEVFRPWLLKRASYTRVDPKEVVNLGTGDKEEYLWRSLVRDVFVGVIEEIIQFVESTEATAKALEKKKKGEKDIKDFQIGK